MKIPFDIKFRPQIESGEYKVVTGDDRPVRIISWDKKLCGGRYEVVALVPTPQGDTETVQLYSPNGTLIASSCNEKFKLFIVTPEPELTEFELALDDVIRSYRCDSEQDENGILSYQDWIKRKAKNLLELARKELKPEVLKRLEEAYKNQDDVVYEIGKRAGEAEALKDLPRWKKCDPNTIYNTKCNFIVNGIGRYIILDGYMIDVDRLEKLPGFKEDEK
jgi:hypothetical protein